MNKQIQFDYEQVNQLVDDYELDISPAHLHGIITASTCAAGINPDAVNPLNLITPYKGLDENQLGHLSDSLNLYYIQTLQVLDDHMFEFELALPDEDSGAEFRTEELAAWCRGFLTAYSHSIKSDEVLSGDAAEALKDLTQIAFAEIGDAQAEEIEQALAELEEYLRVGVQLIFDELNPTQTVH